VTSDPDDEEIIFPLMDELDEMYYAGGEPIPFPETATQAKLSIKMNYSHRVVEMMLSKVLEFKYNVVNGRIVWRRKGSVDIFQRVGDHEENSMLRWLHLHDQIISVSMLHNILTSNFSTYFNPFTEYFKNLQPADPTIDYIGQLIATVKTEDDEYWGRCFRKWYVAFVMSLYRKKVINHTIIVFVGAQGCGKTSWFRVLNPLALREYLSPSATSADHKDTQIMLAECSLIIMDELESLNRRDLAAYKDLATLEFVYVRRPYGRFAVILPRYASIIASVNATQILTDPTGSRRYLCSTVKSIDYEHTVDIDACMAQALALGKSGFKYWFDQEEIRELTYHNEAYMAKSIEEETIETWLRPVSVEEWNNRANLTYGKNISLMKAADISVFLAGKTKQSLVSNSNSIVGKILKKLNFLRLCKDSGYYWIVRIMTDDEVARSRRSLDDSENAEDFEQDLNRYNNPDQFIEGNRKEDELPF
jgi:predicted P-loop ATPase